MGNMMADQFTLASLSRPPSSYVHEQSDLNAEARGCSEGRHRIDHS